MIEISNEELSKVLNLWTETEEWYEENEQLYWDDMCQRRKDKTIVLCCSLDKEAHALVNFMLKERKYPDDVADVFYPTGYTNNHEVYVEWVKDWEKRFGDKPQDDQPKPIDHCEASEQIIDHSIPVRYDHLISTEELVKRAQERWPDDGWEVSGGPVCDGWAFGKNKLFAHGRWGPGFTNLRIKLLTLIDEARSERTTPEILDELEECRKELCKPSPTKAERFYAFLATPQPDISPGLWGLEREPEAPVRGGDNLGWAREDVGALTYKVGWTTDDTKGMTRNWRALVTVDV